MRALKKLLAIRLRKAVSAMRAVRESRAGRALRSPGSGSAEPRDTTRRQLHPRTTRLLRFAAFPLFRTAPFAPCAR